MSKKFKIIIAVLAALLLIAAIVVVLNKDNGSTPDNSENPDIGIDVVGTWYSDKPDSVTFDKDGNYSFSEWNGGNPWLTFAGTYSVSGESVTLQSEQDGTTVLTINKGSDGSFTLSGKYTYYQTEGAAKAALAAAEVQDAEDKKNIVPNTVNKLLGEWTSLDETTTCTFTENSITVHFLGNDVLPEESLYYEYTIISDKQIEINKSGAIAIYAYHLTESSDGTMTFYCTALDYAPTYTKGREPQTTGSDQSATDSSPTAITTDHVISSEKNPDVGAYAMELDAYVKEMLLGEWRGTFDEWPNADSIYFIYTFAADGTYTFSDGEKTEAGTYMLTSDPNNNYYHSALQLTYEGGERAVQFYFTTTNPVKMITDAQTDPTFLKS